MDRRIHLVSVGGRARAREAVSCAMNLQRWNLGPITIHSDEPLWETVTSKIGCEWHAAHRPEGFTDFQLSREIRTTLNQRTKAALNLMLDTDIAVLRDPSGIWDQLGEAWYGMCRDRFSDTATTLHKPTKMGLLGTPEEWAYMLNNNYVSDKVPTFNGGMMLWKPSTFTDAFFSVWRKEWQRFKDRDQQAMSRALWNNLPVLERLKTIDGRWNFYTFNMYYFGKKPPKGADTAVFIHCHIAAKDLYHDEWVAAKELVQDFPKDKTRRVFHAVHAER